MDDRQGDQLKKITFINATVSSLRQPALTATTTAVVFVSTTTRSIGEEGGGWPDKKRVTFNKRPCTTTCRPLFDYGTGVNDLFIVPLPFSGRRPSQRSFLITRDLHDLSASPLLVFLVVVVLFESHYHFSSPVTILRLWSLGRHRDRKTREFKRKKRRRRERFFQPDFYWLVNYQKNTLCYNNDFVIKVTVNLLNCD